jgi:hypothetical protein
MIDGLVDNARRVMSEANYRRVGSPLKILTLRGPTRARPDGGPIAMLVLCNTILRAGIYRLSYS